MTVATQLAEKKPQQAISIPADDVTTDNIDLPSKRTYEGKLIRHSVYLLYIVALVLCGFFLYRNPTQPVLIAFLLVHVILLCSLYFLVRLVVLTETSDVVHDHDGVHWQRRESAPEPATVSRKASRVSAEYLSYSFI